MSLDRSQPPTPRSRPYVEHTSITSSPSPFGYGSANAAIALNAPITRLELFSTRLSTPFVTSISGAVSGIASGVVTCPLDVIKTKLQAQGGFRSATEGRTSPQVAAYRGLVGTANSILREDGIRGMYRGLFPMVLGYFPTWAVYFTVYDRAKGFWCKQLDHEASARRKLLAHLLTSVTAGTCSTLVTNPIWVIKTRLMSQASSNGPTTGGGRAPWHYRSTWDAANKMYATEGLVSFYSGLSPALLGLTHVAVQFPLYEYLKFQFTGLEMGEERNDGHSQWLGISVATVISKICASTATYPHEVLRTRLQTQQRSIGGNGRAPSASAPCPLQGGSAGASYLSDHSRPPGSSPPSPPTTAAPSSSAQPSSHNHPPPETPPRYNGILPTIRTILREEGWRAFYVGMGTNMIRAVPAAVTTILTYESVVGKIKRLQSDGQRKLKASDE